VGVRVAVAVVVGLIVAVGVAEGVGNEFFAEPLSLTTADDLP